MGIRLARSRCISTSDGPGRVYASVGYLLGGRHHCTIKRGAAQAGNMRHGVKCLAAMIIVSQLSTGIAKKEFDVRKHLGTRTRYAHAAPIPDAPHIKDLPDPPGFVPVHLYLLSRHGTRWPTRKRMQQISTLEGVFKSAGVHSEHPWMRGWCSPYKSSMTAAGELHPVGEEEMWALGVRMRHRFPRLLESPYLPARFPIVATQVPRAITSATAFASGFFPPLPLHNYTPQGILISELTDASAGQWAEAECGDDNGGSCMPPRVRLSQAPRPQPVSLRMSPKLNDPLLRFFDMCPAFLHHEDYVKRWLAAWMRGNWRALGARLQKRLRLDRELAPCMVDALWQLCQEEVGLWGETERACSVFTPEELLLLEWQSDVRVVETMAWGAPVNYNMAAPLAKDLRDTLRGVAGLGSPDAAQQRARLLFAHAETIVPFATLLGLFRPDSRSHLEGAAPGEERVEGLLEHNVVNEVVGADSIEEDLPVTLADPDEGCIESKRHTQLLPVPTGWAPRIPRLAQRWWRGASVAPYGANLAIVTYRRIESLRPASSNGTRYRPAAAQNTNDQHTGNCSNGHVMSTTKGQHSYSSNGMHSDRCSNGQTRGESDEYSVGNGSRPHAANANGASGNGLGGGAGGARVEDFVVRLMYNEQVVPFPGCEGPECRLDELLRLLEQKITEDKLDLVLPGGTDVDTGPAARPLLTPSLVL